jgi:Pentapeptide repeats (8 copies).
MVDLYGADLQGVDLLGTKLEGVNLEKAQNLSLNQLSRAETLYNAKIDSELLIPLKEKHPTLLKVLKSSVNGEITSLM